MGIDLARRSHMLFETVKTYENVVRGPDGLPYTVRVCALLRDDGMWEGFVEFEQEETKLVYRTERETTQPNRQDLVYWANGLTPVYLEGAFTRASGELGEAPLFTSAGE